MNSYKDKVVWITGASSGIGAALVKEFADKGAKLVLSSRRTEALEAVKNSNGLNDEHAMVLPLDLLKHDEMVSKVEAVMKKFGRIDLLINNGGISQRSLILDTKFEVYKTIMDIDYLGTVALSIAVLPIFVKQQRGQFAVLSSLMGKFSSPLRSGYCGAKHALHGFFDALRLEHEDDGIGVTMICPGYIRTDISKNAVLADGSKQGKMDDATGAGLSAKECAQQIVQAVTKNKMEVTIGGKETYAVLLKRFFPRLLHRIIKRSAVT